MKYSSGGEFCGDMIDQAAYCIICFYHKFVFSFVLKNIRIELKPKRTVTQAGMTDSMLMADNEQC